jgi:hypothetical protein
VTLLAVAGCSGGPAEIDAPTPSPPSILEPSPSLPSLPDDTLPGYVVHRTELDAPTLSRDALAPDELASLLADARFKAGVQARFTARRRPITEVVARVLRFEDDAGARAYLDWFAGHAADLLGSETEPARSPRAVPDGVAFAHGICDGCTKDTFQYVVAWTRGPYAITLRVGGPAAGPRAADDLAARLDERVATGGSWG